MANPATATNPVLIAEGLVLLGHAEREADTLSNVVRGRRASTLAYELRKTLAELRRTLRALA